MNILDIAIAKKLAGGGGGSGTDNYNDLSNLPKINDTTLSGNKSSSALGLQSEINSDSKLASDLVDDTNQDNKFVTSTEKNTWNGKQNAIDADHKINADYVDDSTSTNKFVTASDKETWNAKQNAIDNSHKLSSDLVDDANHTNKFVTSTEKQTWNAKQNAIDADHKLSSSLVSFTTAEAAALASGIDSTKVGQISTNQTNILYSINNGVKNICDYVNHLQLNNCEIVDGEFKQTVTDSKANLNFMASAVRSDGTTYALFTSVTITANGEYSYEFNFPADAVAIRIGHNGTTRDAKFDINVDHFVVGTTYVISINVLNCVQSSGVYRFNKIMICTKQLWDTIGHGFMPPALPNYDLTRLESEDRAGLVECVDGGAKNKLQNKATSKTQNNVTYTVNADGEVTVSTTRAASANTTLSLTNAYIPNTFKGNIISGVPTGTTSDTICLYVAYSSNGSSEAKAIYVNAASNPIHEILDYPYIQIFVFIHSGVTVSTALKFQPMICTKAAFGVSQKFVPYAKSNYDLTQDKLNRCSKQLTSGSLNNIKDNEIYYVSADVTDMPTASRAWGFVRTTMYGNDKLYGMQEFFSVTDPYESYFRVIRNGTWQPWIKTGGN